MRIFLLAVLGHHNGTFTLTTYDLDQQRLISVYLASNIEAIRHINFALANSQSM